MKLLTQGNINNDIFTCAEFYYNNLILTLERPSISNYFFKVLGSREEIFSQFHVDLFMKIINEKSYNTY